MAADTVSALKKASKGLLYPSEYDAPFQTFVWKGQQGQLTKQAVRQLGKYPTSAPVEQVSLEDFFGELTAEDSGASTEDAEKYRALLQVIKEQLSGVKVFRVGETKVTIYIVGRSKDGDLAGLKTTSVET
jgi:hypothetical protein